MASGRMPRLLNSATVVAPCLLLNGFLSLPVSSEWWAYAGGDFPKARKSMICFGVFER